MSTELDEQLSSFCALTLFVGHLACEYHPENDPSCVDLDVKLSLYCSQLEISSSDQ